MAEASLDQLSAELLTKTSRIDEKRLRRALGDDPPQLGDWPAVIRRLVEQYEKADEDAINFEMDIVDYCNITCGRENGHARYIRLLEGLVVGLRETLLRHAPDLPAAFRAELPGLGEAAARDWRRRMDGCQEGMERVRLPAPYRLDGGGRDGLPRADRIVGTSFDRPAPGIDWPLAGDWCHWLRITIPATAAAVRRAFKREAMRLHPDKPNGSHAAFCELQRAYGAALGQAAQA